MLKRFAGLFAAIACLGIMACMPVKAQLNAGTTGQSWSMPFTSVVTFTCTANGYDSGSYPFVVSGIWSWNYDTSYGNITYYNGGGALLGAIYYSPSSTVSDDGGGSWSMAIHTSWHDTHAVSTRFNSNGTDFYADAAAGATANGYTTWAAAMMTFSVNEHIQVIASGSNQFDDYSSDTGTFTIYR